MRSVLKVLLVVILGVICGAGVATILFPHLSKSCAQQLLEEKIRSSRGLRWEGLARKTVTAIVGYYDARLLVGTVGEGLWQFDPAARKAERLSDDLGRPTAGAITCLLRGRDFIFAGTFDGQEYWLKPGVVWAGFAAYTPYYSCDWTDDEEYVVALWRGVAFWPAKERQTDWFSLRFKPAHLEMGVTSVVFLAKDQLAWSRIDGGVSRGRLREGKIVEIETLPSLPPGVSSLAWFEAGRKLFATQSDKSFELYAGAWRPLVDSSGDPLRVLGCKNVLGQGCWVASAAALGVLRSDGHTEWTFNDFPLIPVTCYADSKSARVFVGTVGAGLVSFSVPTAGHRALD